MLIRSVIKKLIIKIKKKNMIKLILELPWKEFSQLWLSVHKNKPNQTIHKMEEDRIDLVK